MLDVSLLGFHIHTHSHEMGLSAVCRLGGPRFSSLLRTAFHSIRIPLLLFVAAAAVSSPRPPFFLPSCLRQDDDHSDHRAALLPLLTPPPTVTPPSPCWPFRFFFYLGWSVLWLSLTWPCAHRPALSWSNPQLAGPLDSPVRPALAEQCAVVGRSDSDGAPSLAFQSLPAEEKNKKESKRGERGRRHLRMLGTMHVGRPQSCGIFYFQGSCATSPLSLL